jgi:hypothetical protein
MGLLQKLKNIIEGAGYQFLYDSNNGLNELFDNVEFPEKKSVIYVNLLGGTKLVEGIESGNIALFFCRKTEFDFDTLENEKIIQECLYDARNFEILIKRGNVLTISGELLIERFYDNFSVNVTGVAVNVNLSETVGMAECLDGSIYIEPEPEPGPGPEI